jgi:hypothetical protein
MAVNPSRWLVAVMVALTAYARAAEGQTINTVNIEADFTGGIAQYSDESISALATQLRLFGELKSSVQFFVEGTWAGRNEDESDAFSSAYPYEGHPTVMEAFAERMFHPGGALFGIRAGRYRTPFGIYNRGDYAYSGLMRAPLIRYENDFALENTFLEHGIDLIAGVPRFTVETSLSAPGDAGEAQRRSGFDSVTRAQGYYGPLLVGVSHLRSNPYQTEDFARGRTVFTGLDFRFMLGGVQLSGEWIDGRPFDGASTTGWHIGSSVHRPFMGAVTAVVRFEQLDCDNCPVLALHAKRQTIGARVRLPRGLTAQVGYLHHTGFAEDEYGSAFDAALTYSVRLR